MKAELVKEFRSLIWNRLYAATNGNEGWLTPERVQFLIDDIYDFLPTEVDG